MWISHKKSHRRWTHSNETMPPPLDPLENILCGEKESVFPSRLTHSWLVSLKAMLYYNFFVFSWFSPCTCMQSLLPLYGNDDNNNTTACWLLLPPNATRRHFCQDFFLPSARQSVVAFNASKFYCCSLIQTYPCASFDSECVLCCTESAFL